MRAYCTGYETLGRRGGVHTQPASWKTSTAVKFNADGKDVRVTLKGDAHFVNMGSSHARLATLDMHIHGDGSSSTNTLKLALDTTDIDNIKILKVIDETSGEFATRYGEIDTKPVETPKHARTHEDDDGYGSKPAADNSPAGKAKALVDDIWNGWGFCDPQIAELRELLANI